MNKITNIEAFIEANLSSKWVSDYCRTEARILNSFFKRLVTDHGYTICTVYDGEENIVITNNDRFEALYHIFSVDSSSVVVTAPDETAARLFLLIGEGEAQTIYDQITGSEDVDSLIDKVWTDCAKTYGFEI